jgi:hypothetical protein
MTTENIQVAPYPHKLADLVSRCSYRAHEGWVLDLVEDAQRDKDADGTVIGHGLTLSVLTKGFDSYRPENGATYRVYHYFIVPAATYNRASWQRWLFDQLLKVETHECMEHFIIDGERPMAPLHGPGDNPYSVHEYATDLQRRTKFTGEVLEA